ncbi:restriction endonuclease subunit S [Pseudoalteromonas sp. XMcav11-Q]|uniref:restriction endonuclease subunit S n=1 Tax=Pseudoalteromonas sp. XMcav11-Q TaxID=3136665 RepID=UPI0032C431EC
MNELPKGWVETSIESFCLKPEQRTPSEDEFFNYVDIGSVCRESKEIEITDKILGCDAPSRARKVINENDIIVSMTRPNLNAVAKVGKVLNNQIASTGFDVLKPVMVEPNWLFSIVKSKKFISAISEETIGALYPACKTSDIRSYAAPLPPLKEQKRIVEKLDDVLAQVDAIKGRLDSIPAIIKRFRQSVLASAVSGKLTEEWRKETKYEKYDLKLSKRNSSLNIPKNWAVKRIGDACKIISGNAFKSKELKDEGEVPVIKISNVQYGKFEVKNQQYLALSYLSNYESYSVKEDDLLMALTRPITNGSLKVCRYPEKSNTGLLNQRVCKFEFNNEDEKDFYELLFQSSYFKEQVEDNLSETLQPNLSPKDLKQLIVYIPSTQEQKEIVRLVDEYFAFADTIEAQVNKARTRVDNLTQSILAKAFRGELVPQDDNDEPAEKLLERIAQAKAEAEALAKAVKKAEAGKKRAAKTISK